MVQSGRIPLQEKTEEFPHVKKSQKERNVPLTKPQGELTVQELRRKRSRPKEEDQRRGVRGA